MEDGRTILVGAEHAISDQHMEVYVAVEITAEAVDKSHGAKASAGRRIGWRIGWRIKRCVMTPAVVRWVALVVAAEDISQERVRTR